MANICSIKKSEYHGFESYILTNGHIQICVVPELGGKITSIKDLSTGREWLWSNPYLPKESVVYGASFIEKYDTGGLDECFPAVLGGEYPDEPWDGIVIPDHGELWCQPWETKIVESSAKKIILTMSCHGVRFPYHFERTLTISAESPVLMLDYQVSNLSNFEMLFLWRIHPLINIEKGMQVILPPEIKTLRLDSGTNNFLGESGSQIGWPQTNSADNRPIDLSQVPANNFGQAYKLYTYPIKGDAQVEAGIIDPTGKHSFIFRFQPKEITHVGLWMNYGAWSGSGSEPYFNLGLEPSIGGTDGLSNAKDRGEYGNLPAKESRLWTLELLVT